MTMENLMKVLMDSAMQQSQQPAPRQQAQQQQADPLAGVLGSLLGGAQQQAPQQQQAAGGDMLGQLVGGLLGGTMQQPATQQQQPAGGDMLGQLVGGLLGGAQQQAGGYQQSYQPAAGNSGDMLLGALESIIGGQPGTGQALPMNQGSFNLGANSPVMMLLQPVVNQVAGKLNISPQIATVVASIALHYLLSSHPSTSPNAPMNLGNVMQQMAGGGVSQGALRNSGMVQDVMSATGLDKQQALQTLETALGAMAAGVQGQANTRRG